MRPIRLTMQAFGPFAGREVIDFRSSVEVGLFGIYGPTGSGKSTIFSAMTFALFGESAKADQDSATFRSDHADPELPTEVELVFDIGERRFVIRRRPEQIRPKQRGSGAKRDAHEATFFDATGLAVDEITVDRSGKIIEEKKVGLVGKAVENLLGYGSAQFRQIVLLPQGRFEAFLTAKTKERLDILRDLFDVSIYRRLAAKFKVDAESAERLVREEREVCARLLSTNGFESTDGLAAGIAEADLAHGKQVEIEEAVREEARVAKVALDCARETENQFLVVEAAQKALENLRDRSREINALAERVRNAERARGLLDLEERVNEAALEITTATNTRDRKKAEAESAKSAAETAAATHDLEITRSAEIDVLRREINSLERHGVTIEKAVDVTNTTEEAAKKASIAKKALDEITVRIETLTAERKSQNELLRAARRTETQRLTLQTRLAEMESGLKKAEAFERAGRALTEADLRAVHLKAGHNDAIQRATAARINSDAAEHRLAEAQALHLAAKLKPGDPCPVCGAIDHPAPATGRIEVTGLDKAFREAKAAWEAEQTAERQAEIALTSALGILSERQEYAAKLEPPERSSAELRDAIQASHEALSELGSETDIVNAENLLDVLERQVADAEVERNLCSGILSEAEAAAASTKGRLDELLSSVPEMLRERVVLDSAIASRRQALDARERALESAAKRAMEAREAALSAKKELEAAEKAFSNLKDRLTTTRHTFETRLNEIEMTEEQFLILKPAIDSVESDREAVEEHRRKLRNAEEEANKAQSAIQGKERSDLRAFEGASMQADGAVIATTELRVRAATQLDYLRKLQSDLTEALQRIDVAELESGSLRELAALFDAQNPSKLDLETFAIGAMFGQVLVAANHRLGPMTAGRYVLEREVETGGRGRRGLGIQVFDVYTGKARPTSTLSGGETFIAALALALGLADIVESANGKVRLDTIFIDEGFGSLDTENGTGTLDQVLQVLNSLVSQNRAVGLISHVPFVQETIQNGFYVRKDVLGSHIETREML